MRTFEAYHRGLVSAEDVVELIGILARLAGVSSSCTYFNRFSQLSWQTEHSRIQ